MNMRVSTLAHTWMIDIDGTVLQHNGHKKEGDRVLPGVREFWSAIPPMDTIILLSSRTVAEKEATLEFMAQQGLRFNQALFGLPKGERILINDIKPRGLQTALAINVSRDSGLHGVSIMIDPDM